MKSKTRSSFRQAPWIIPLALFAALASFTYVYRPVDLPATDAATKKQSATYMFEDVTTAHAIPVSRTPTWGSAWVDHDRDGWPELLINRHKRLAWFFSGGPAGLDRVDQPALEKDAPGRNYYDRHACAWGEADGDGSPDLYCVAGAQKGLGTGHNQLLSLVGGRFIDVANDYGLTDAAGRGRTVNWIDFEGDGDLDLFVGNEVRSGQPNRTFRNDRGRFRLVDVGLTEEIATINSTVADWDNDGDTDLLVLGHGDKGSIAYENLGGYFRPVSIPRISNARWVSAAWADFDDDGWIDLHLMSRHTSILFKNDSGVFRKKQGLGLRTGRMSTWMDVENDGDLDLFVVQGEARGKWRSLNREDFLLLQSRGSFAPEYIPSVRGTRAGSGDAVSAADHDRDGRVDVLVTNGYLEQKGRIQLLRNVSKAGRWLGISLHGDAWNPLGIGARVEITGQGGLRRVFHVTDGFNFKAQSEAGYVHVGLRDRLFGRVRVVWADGSSDCTSAVSGVVTTIKQGSEPCSGVSPRD
ncbi:MAG: FG-GAP repeat domain-containing protein [Actinomycetota bacterium]